MKIKKKKLAYIQRHWKGPMLLALQETHASVHSMHVLLERLGRPFCCFASCMTGGREDAGGVAT
eukprot:2908448-Pyramimonas_sp.AAC.1